MKNNKLIAVAIGALLLITIISTSALTSCFFLDLKSRFKVQVDSYIFLGFGLLGVGIYLGYKKAHKK
jgi:hypothetical protein